MSHKGAKRRKLHRKIEVQMIRSSIASERRAKKLAGSGKKKYIPPSELW